MKEKLYTCQQLGIEWPDVSDERSHLLEKELATGVPHVCEECSSITLDLFTNTCWDSEKNRYRLKVVKSSAEDLSPTLFIIDETRIRSGARAGCALLHWCLQMYEGLTLPSRLIDEPWRFRLVAYYDRDSPLNIPSTDRMSGMTAPSVTCLQSIEFHLEIADLRIDLGRPSRVATYRGRRYVNSVPLIFRFWTRCKTRLRKQECADILARRSRERSLRSQHSTS